MPRTVRNPKIDTRSARAKLKARREPYWTSIAPGCALGYRRSAKAGTWIGKHRASDGKRSYKAIGPADDIMDADNASAISFTQAQEQARDWFSRMALGGDDEDGEEAGPYTVRLAINDYFDWYASEKPSQKTRNLRDMEYRANAFILPRLGEVEVSKLTPKAIRAWRNEVAAAPPRVRAGIGKPVAYRDTSDDPEAERKRRHSANKVATILRAALNHAWHERKVLTDAVSSLIERL